MEVNHAEAMKTCLPDGSVAAKAGQQYASRDPRVTPQLERGASQLGRRVLGLSQEISTWGLKKSNSVHVNATEMISSCESPPVKVLRLLQMSPAV